MLAFPFQWKPAIGYFNFPPCCVDSCWRKQGVCSLFLSLLKTYGWKTWQLRLGSRPLSLSLSSMARSCALLASEGLWIQALPREFLPCSEQPGLFDSACMEKLNGNLSVSECGQGTHGIERSNLIQLLRKTGCGAKHQVAESVCHYKLYLCHTFIWPCKLATALKSKYQTRAFTAFLSSSFIFVNYFLNSTEKCSAQTYFSGQDIAQNDLEMPDTIDLSPPFRCCSLRRG